MEQLANQCPLTNGTAVFRARSMLSIVSDLVYDDDVLCQGGQQSSMKPNNNNQVDGFELYPNPAHSIVTAKLPNELRAKGQLIMFNGIGKEVLRIEIPSETISINVDVQHLSNGVYTCSVMENDNEIYTKRLVITK